MPRWDEPRRQRREIPAPIDRAGERPTAIAAIERMIAVSGWTPSTMRSARSHLLGERFTTFLADHGVVTIDQLTTEHAAAYLAVLRTHVGPATVNKCRSYLLTLERFCARTPGYGSGLERVRDAHPAVRVPRHDRPVLSAGDETRLLAACTSERDRLLLLTLVGTGMRASELCALRLDDLHLDAKNAYAVIARSVHGETTKSGKDRWVPIGRTLARRLERWIADGRPKAHRREVFLGAGKGVQGLPRPMTVASLEAVFKRLQETTGVYCRPHLCRHTWATRAANAGTPIVHLMQAGGWADLDIVRVYYTGDRVEMLESFGRIHG